MLNFQEFKAIFFHGRELEDENADQPFGMDGPAVEQR